MTSIRLVKRFSMTGTSGDRETYTIDLDVEENNVLKNKDAIETPEYQQRFSIVSKMIFANKMKDILIYTNEYDKLQTHLQQLCDELRKSIVVPTDTSGIGRSFVTNLLTTPLKDEIRLEGGLMRSTIELRRNDGSSKPIALRVEYYQH